MHFLVIFIHQRQESLGKGPLLRINCTWSWGSLLVLGCLGLLLVSCICCFISCVGFSICSACRSALARSSFKSPFGALVTLFLGILGKLFFLYNFGVFGVRVDKEPVVSVVLQVDLPVKPRLISLLTSETGEECLVAPIVAFQPLLARGVECLILSPDQPKQHHQLDEQLDRVLQTSHGKRNSVFQGFGLVLIPKLEEVLILEKVSLKLGNLGLGFLLKVLVCPHLNLIIFKFEIL